MPQTKKISKKTASSDQLSRPEYITLVHDTIIAGVWYPAGTQIEATEDTKQLLIPF